MSLWHYSTKDWKPIQSDRKTSTWQSLAIVAKMFWQLWIQCFWQNQYSYCIEKSVESEKLDQQKETLIWLPHELEVLCFLNTISILILAIAKKGSFKVDHRSFKHDGKYKRAEVRDDQMTKEQINLKHAKDKTKQTQKRLNSKCSSNSKIQQWPLHWRLK